MRLPGSFDPEGKLDELAIGDLSCLSKVGLKGPQAAAWLSGRGIPIPARPNSWTALPAGGLIARLAEAEFLLEDGISPGSAIEIATAIESAPANVYPVPRHDVAIALIGQRINEVLLQTCNVDFSSIDAEGTLVLTLMIGVPVLVIPQTHDGLPMIRIWADPSFGPYLWQTLLGIVRELTGGPVGLIRLFPQTQNQGGSL